MIGTLCWPATSRILSATASTPLARQSGAPMPGSYCSATAKWVGLVMITVALGTAAIMRLRTRWARIWRSFALTSGLPSEFLYSSFSSCFVIFWRWYQE
jgi:hypothetical protein